MASYYVKSRRVFTEIESFIPLKAKGFRVEWVLMRYSKLCGHQQYGVYESLDEAWGDISGWEKIDQDSKYFGV